MCNLLLWFRLPLMLCCLLVLALPLIAAPLLDTLTLGDAASEQQHHLVSDHSDTVAGGLGQSARRLLPLDPPQIDGGSVAFTMKVNPQKMTYVTVRFWGGDFGSDRGRLTLFCEGKQVGYQHLGDVSVLDIAGDAPAVPGRFYYVTEPLPLAMTQGQTQVPLQIRSMGRIWGYGMTPEQYFKTLAQPSRGIYAVYTHTDGYFAPPVGEVQGTFPHPVPLRKMPGAEVLTQLKDRLTHEIKGMLSSTPPLTQTPMQILAQAYDVSWTPAYHNPEAIAQVVKGADALFTAYQKDTRIAQDAPDVPNGDWQGLGPIGDAIFLLGKPLQPFLDQPVSGGTGQPLIRRAAWSQMLQASRDWHRRNRRQYTNQSMITDLNIYTANRGVEAIDPAHALPETQALDYLYQCLSLEPWLGSDTDHGPEKPLGDHYYEMTSQGLTKELGYVGNYGEVLDWATQIYDATCDPGQPGTGDKRIQAQVEKMAQARAHFRYPALDADGNRAMRLETIVGWRDTDYPGDITYGERSAWEGSAIFEAATAGDPREIGYAQQMFADNQFFASVADLLTQGGPRVSKTLLPIPDQYQTLRSLPPSPYRLPMTPGQSDFAWADPEDGVLTVKHGDQCLYVSLYWRARYAINFLARVHLITPQYERIAVVHEDEQFVPSGQFYTRPDWTDEGFGNGGLPLPGDVHSALAGERLPIAAIPPGIEFHPGDENPYAGRASFYQLRYGPYLIGMNSSTDTTYTLTTPAGLTQAPDLISKKTLSLRKSVRVPPQSTVVLYLGPQGKRGRR